MKLTDQQLQYLRNEANEYEQAADEIVELRAELESERACGVESMAMYRRARDERDALLALLRDAREQVDMVGCSQEGYDEMCRERDAMLARIDAALAKGQPK